MPGCVSSANPKKRKRKLEKNNTKPLIWPLIIVLVVVALDQATKIWALNALTGRGSVEVFGNFFMFTLVFNQGGALGTNLGSSIYYLIISILILPFLFYYVYRYRFQLLLSWPLAFISAGALGNIIDRIYLGQVVDFIDIDFFDFNFFGQHIQRWWTFNIADAAISCGIVFLLVISFLPGKFLEKLSESSEKRNEIGISTVANDGNAED